MPPLSCVVLAWQALNKCWVNKFCFKKWIFWFKLRRIFCYKILLIDSALYLNSFTGHSRYQHEVWELPVSNLSHQWTRQQRDWNQRLKIKLLQLPRENQLLIQIPLWYLSDCFKKDAGNADVPQWATFMEVSIAAIKSEVGEIKVLKENCTQSWGSWKGRQAKVTWMLPSPEPKEWGSKYELHLLHNFAQDWHEDNTHQSYRLCWASPLDRSIWM